MRKLLHTILQALIDAEASQHIGADRHQCTDTRRAYRNGTRDKTVSTTSGDLTVKSPRHTHRVLLPSLLTPRRRIDMALHAVVMQAYVHGVSTRKVDDLVAALGAESGISRVRSHGSAELGTTWPRSTPGTWASRVPVRVLGRDVL
jgi:putative transposase